MSLFFDWLIHRLNQVGYVSPTHFCRAACLNHSRLVALQSAVWPRNVLTEPDLWRLAPLLHTSLKQLRRLIDGQISWIDDDHYTGAAIPVFHVLPAAHASSDAPFTEPSPARTAAIGRITPSGEVDLEEHWDPDHGPWLPCRVGSGKGTFALRVLPFNPDHRLDRWAVFRFVRGDCLPEQQDVAVFLRSDAEAIGLFGRLTVIGDAIALRLQDQSRTTLELTRSHIAQLARVVGNWPQGLIPRISEQET